MKRRLIFLIVAMLLFNSVNAWAFTGYVAKQPDYEFVVNNESLKNFPVTDINGDYYIPVRDAAEFFGFHAEKVKGKSGLIRFAEGNTSNSDAKSLKMIDLLKKKNKEIKPTKLQITCNNKTIKTKLITINGYAFIKMKDVVDFFGISMYKNDKEKKVIISAQRDVFMEMTEEQRAEYEKYLKSNALEIDEKDFKVQKNLQNAGLDRYKLILLGEHHATAKNFQIQLFFIKYLSENQHVRYILTENGYCDAMLLNRYLNSGDDSILQKMMENLKGTFAYSKNMYDFYKGIYEYNKTLPSDRKLTFIGIDIQHQTDTGIDYLISLIPSTGGDEKIKKNMDKLRLMEDSKLFDGNQLSLILKAIEDSEAEYQKYFGNDYECFYNGLKNVLQLFECKNGTDEMFMRLREKRMIENFEKQCNNLEDAKFIGLLGGAHTSLNRYLDSDKKEPNFATYLNTKDEKTAGKIANISEMYHNSSYMDSRTGESVKMDDLTLEKIMAQYIMGDFGIFPLDKENSVFLKDGSTGSQQYLLLIKNSPAAEMFTPVQ